MRWTSQAILQALRHRHASGQPLGYRALARENRSLVSAAAYHFGSFRIAVERAGVDYALVSSRPRWTTKRIIQTLKQARREGQDLSWTAIVAPDSTLRRAAFVAVQKRLFGSWARALEAAGVDSDATRRYQDWNPATVSAELKQLRANGEPLNSFAVLKSHPALHAAAIRHFGSYRAALNASGFASLRRKPHGKGRSTAAKRPR